MNFVSGFFLSIIISHTPHLIFLHLVTLCVVFSPNVVEVSIFFNDFCAVSDF